MAQRAVVYGVRLKSLLLAMSEECYYQVLFHSFFNMANGSGSFFLEELKVL